MVDSICNLFFSFLSLQPHPPPPHLMQQIPPHAQYMPVKVPFSQGPPSMISALDDTPAERRVITLPPIREQHQGRMPPQAPKTRPPSSSESGRSGFGHRDERSTVRIMPRSYSQDSLDGHSRSGARRSMERPRSRSRDDLLENRSRANYSPPASRHSRRGSWSSDDERTSRRGGRRGGAWGDQPSSFIEFEPGQKPGARRNQRYSVRHTVL